MLRHMRTKQEITISRDVLHKKYTRPKRNRRILPDYWDDIFRNTNRNWKEYRKQQYKF